MGLTSKYACLGLLPLFISEELFISRINTTAEGLFFYFPGHQIHLVVLAAKHMVMCLYQSKHTEQINGSFHYKNMLQ